jgi:outer membrane protein assembly factor BamD (BamD/ComL family)
MSSEKKDSFLNQFKWHLVVICMALAIVVLLTMFTNIFQSAQSTMLRQLVFMLGVLVFLSALLAMLSRLFKILDALRDNSAKLEAVAGALENISAGLTQINHSTRVSETVKAIAFRDADRQSLREAVFDKLQQQEFDAAQEIIDEIAMRSEYSELAEQLRAQVEQYHTATDQERINQAIAHIEKLLDNCYWARASAQIEGLIKAYPDSEKAKLMRHILFDNKQSRKKILLAAWDDAVKQQETDRSLEILKELDLYLTPNEGLALQEAARDIFRTKLHNLGVQFSIAVTEKQWNGAFNIGRQIIKDFPNSRMSEEIRGKLDVLEQNVQMQNS